MRFSAAGSLSASESYFYATVLLLCGLTVRADTKIDTVAVVMLATQQPEVAVVGVIGTLLSRHGGCCINR